MRRPTLALLSLTLLTGIAQGGDLTVSSEPFAVSVQREPVNTTEPIFRAFVSVGDNKFTFVVPEKFSTSGDPAHGRLQFKTLDGDSFITLYFVSSETSGLTSEACRGLLLERYAGGSIVKEFTRPVGGQSARAFDVEWKSAPGFAMVTRAVYFQTPCGNVELTITAGAKKFKAARTEFNGLLTTFANSANGKLVVRHIGGSN